MRKSRFIVVVAHSIHGRMSRVHVPNYVIHVGLAVLLLASIVSVGLFSSYARMASKTLAFNKMRTEKEILQKKYNALVDIAKERKVQIESLGNLATEVSLAFGIKRHKDHQVETELDFFPRGSYSEALSKYGLLQQVQLSTTSDSPVWDWLANTTPSIWPVKGRLSSSFGKRKDPFQGTDGFHAGVDITAPQGTPIVAAADGIVTHSGWFARYGKRVILDHGDTGLSSSYAHMNKFYVHPGQMVRRGEVIGQVGQTGKSTSPHLHYEIRYLGTPVNPYQYLRSTSDFRLNFQTAD